MNNRRLSLHNAALMAALVADLALCIWFASTLVGPVVTGAVHRSVLVTEFGLCFAVAQIPAAFIGRLVFDFLFPLERP